MAARRKARRLKVNRGEPVVSPPPKAKRKGPQILNPNTRRQLEQVEPPPAAPAPQARRRKKKARRTRRA